MYALDRLEQSAHSHGEACKDYEKKIMDAQGIAEVF